MSASSTRVIVAAAVLLLLALVGGLGWQRMRPSSTAHVEMLTSLPQGTRGMLQPAAQPSSATPPTPGVAAEREGAPQPPSGADPLPPPPSFDIVRVEPSGEALLAGRGAPNGTVALVDRGRVVAAAKADADGNFIMTPPALKPGDYALSLREGQGAAARDSKQSVVVSVPASKTQPVVVAMAELGRATTLLSAPPELAKAMPAPTAPKPISQSSAPPAKLAIRSVELENGSGLFASGVAPPGTDVRLYLNDSRVADVIAAAAGSWTVTVHRGLAAGRYAVRADSLKADRSVGARVEVPFDVPASMSEAAAHAAAPEAAAAPRVESSPAQTRIVAEVGGSAGGGVRNPAVAAVPEARMPTCADAIVDELKTELVTRGGNLWRISRNRLGHGTRYTEIYAANTAQIRDPKLIYPGQVFVLPRE